ncbi:MAG TPA: hypothetical protein VLC46_00010 [Thermoanaerobaculia bacterium]|nr:hypothetical protein [Thermoanaerobaculia bacterium]
MTLRLSCSGGCPRQVLDDFEAVELGHHQVEDDRSELLACDRSYRLFAVLRGLNRVAVPGQDRRDQCSDRFVIINDKNPRRLAPMHAGSLAGRFQHRYGQ